MKDNIDIWESDNIKKTVNKILVIFDGLPLNFAEHILDEARKELMSHAIIQTSEYSQQKPSAILDRTDCKQ